MELLHGRRESLGTRLYLLSISPQAILIVKVSNPVVVQIRSVSASGVQLVLSGITRAQQCRVC